MNYGPIFITLINLCVLFATEVFAYDQRKFDDAVLECATELVISKPENDSRPNYQEREKMKACLAFKGFTPRKERIRRDVSRARAK